MAREILKKWFKENKIVVDPAINSIIKYRVKHKDIDGSIFDDIYEEIEKYLCDQYREIYQHHANNNQCCCIIL